MTNTLRDLTESLLSAARKAGADEADAIAVEGTKLSIDVLNGKLEHAERAEGTDIGLRVLIGQRQACVSASDTRNDTIITMAERAVAMAREAPLDETIGLADPSDLAHERDVDSLEMEDPEGEPLPGDLEQAARRAEAASLAVKGVSKVQAASAGFNRHRIHLAATNGFSGGYGRTSHAMYCVAITGEGTQMERDSYGESLTYRADLPSPEDVGRIAGKRTVARAGARKPPTGAFPVLFDERVSGSLIGHLLSAINGTAIARGSSWARDFLGEDILPPDVSLAEEPRRRRGARTRPFDAEGLATATRMIVENGRLTGWILDLATGRKLGMASTANATRGTSAPPSPSAGNIRLGGPLKSRDSLLSEMGTGLIVTSLIGSSINPTTGDYSRGASGFWVENGTLAYPVNECTIAGNLKDILRTMELADDARPTRSQIVPSLLVEGLTLAGE